MGHKIKVLVNGMIYGDGYTKFMLWSIFLLGVLTIGSLIIAAAFFSLTFVGAAVVFAAVDAYLIHGLDFGTEMKGGVEASDDEESDDEDDDEEDEDEEDEGLTIELLDAEEDLKDKEEKKKAKKEKKAKKSKDKKKKDKKVKESSNDLAEKKSENKSETKLDNKASISADNDSNASISPAQSDYTEHELKALFKKYKVKKNHRPILVDHSDKYKIKECPAFAWTTRNNFNILLMEDEPRKLTFGLEALGKISYARSYPANQKKEYDCLVGQDLIALVFSEYRPVYQSVSRTGYTEEAKNLYMLEPDIYITAPSAREIMILASPDFIVDDEVTQSEDYNQYYKQAYKQKILLDDGVLNIRDYQARIKVILQKLSEATITPAAFRMTLQEMTMQQLITTEYATYYTQVNRQIRERRGEQV
ncbi:MAG: hypothetical protein K5656_04425 [Lachnospiraceae bacterium]|nr:hypothetical protein [Lachnospiraceae bacterium]